MIKEIVHFIIRSLPDRVRRHLLPMAVGKLLSPLVVYRRDIRSGPVTVAGFLTSTVGLGQSARFVLSALREMGCESRYIDAGDIFYWHKNMAEDLGAAAKPNEGGTIIFHLNPPELAMVLPLLGRKLLRHKRIIGFWAWELDVIPRNWLPGFRLVDEIWAPSKFVAAALRRSTNIPVRVVHYPVSMSLVLPIDRSEFKLPDSSFIVLVMFDMRSSAERKNPIGAIHAFRSAFGERDDVLLLLKISNPSEHKDVMSRIEREVGQTNNIRLMFDKLSSRAQINLMSCSDVVMSLHRSEGFGLVLAEAMLMGKPVIATSYSGNMDFMDSTCAALVQYELVPISDPQRIYEDDRLRWAEPNLEDASEWLRKLKNNVALREHLGAMARRKAAEIFSVASFEAAIGGVVECNVQPKHPKEIRIDDSVSDHANE